MYNFFRKPVESSILIQKEVATSTNTHFGVGEGVLWTQFDRTIDGQQDIFVSLNLPTEYSKFPPSCDVSMKFPELQFLNVDKIAVGVIGREEFSDFIDGSSLHFELPAFSFIQSKLIYSSTYFNIQKRQNYPILGESIAFLFCDKVARPYSGTVSGGIATRDSGNTLSWSSATQFFCPAVSLSELQESDYMSDDLNFSAIVLNKFNRTDIPTGYPFTSYRGFNYDVPVGFVDLKRGFIVLTAYDLVQNFPWSVGYYNNDVSMSYSGVKENVGFRKPGQVFFNDISIKYNVETVFEAQPYEFFMSSNPTWDLDRNLQILQSGGTGYDSVYFTEIGMYNKNGELMAVSKLNQPVQKGYEQLMNFEMRVKI